jgi:hypothetical protein
MAFIGHLILTRLLGANAYGVYAYALSWMMALIVPDGETRITTNFFRPCEG